MRAANGKAPSKRDFMVLLPVLSRERLHMDVAARRSPSPQLSLSRIREIDLAEG